MCENRVNCCDSPESGLRYNGFSMVFMQVFTLPHDLQFTEPKDIATVDFSRVETNIGDARDGGKNFLVRKNSKGTIESFIFERPKVLIDNFEGVVSTNEDSRRAIKRYILPGFNLSMQINPNKRGSYGPLPIIKVEGEVHVEMSLFFNRTVIISYRLVRGDDSLRCCEITAKETEEGVIFSEICGSDNVALYNDHLILLAALNHGAENWTATIDKNNNLVETDINANLKDAIFSDLKIDEQGNYSQEFSLDYCIAECNKSSNPFPEICRRYKECLINEIINNSTQRVSHYDRSAIVMRDTKFTLVDIWESISDHNGSFEALGYDEVATIEHIKEYHKPELIGLMSLYPGEWPFRDPSAFEEVCGESIAIDTDDLVLVNSDMAVVFGTYGLRGEDAQGVDWKAHLKMRSRYHVSWPEYMLILEMILAKKHTIAYANEQIIVNSLVLDRENDEYRLNEVLSRNADLQRRLTRLMLLLNVSQYAKFVSHKVMFERTEKRLHIDEMFDDLNSSIGAVNDYLHNITETKGVKQGFNMGFILLLISIFSLFEIFFQEVRLPFVQYISMNLFDDKAEFISSFLGNLIILISVFGLIFGLIIVFVRYRQHLKNIARNYLNRFVNCFRKGGR